MKLFLMCLVIFVSFDAMVTIGIFKTKTGNQPKAAHQAGRRHRLNPRKAVINKSHVLHSADPLQHLAIAIREQQPVHYHKDVHGHQKDRANRILHPKFRAVKTIRVQPTTLQKVIQRQHPVHPTRLLANSSFQQKHLSEMNHHYQEQIHAFFQNQHQHPPIPTRPRPKHGLKKRKK